MMGCLCTRAAHLCCQLLSLPFHVPPQLPQVKPQQVWRRPLPLLLALPQALRPLISLLLLKLSVDCMLC